MIYHTINIVDIIADYWHDPLDTARFISALAAHTWGSQIELANTERYCRN